MNLSVVQNIQNTMYDKQKKQEWKQAIRNLAQNPHKVMEMVPSPTATSRKK